MKRFALRCAALLGLVLFLTACEPKQDIASDNPIQNPPIEGTPTALPFAVGRLYDLDWANYTSGVNDGKAFYKLELIAEMPEAADSQQRGYNYLITRIDYETRVQSPLCSLPGCTHKSTDCPAYVGGMYWEYFTLSVVEGQLYVLHTFHDMTAAELGSANQEQATVWLDAAAMDGSGRRRLAELPAGWEIDDGNFPATDGTALFGQYADLSDDSIHGVRVALETGEVTAFSFGLDDNETLLGAWEGQFMLRRSDNSILQTAYPGVMTHELNNLFQSKFSSSSAGSLLLYDPTAGTRTDLNDVLLQAGLFNVHSIFLQQGKLYHIAGDDEIALPQAVWQIDPAGGTARILTELAPPSVAWYFLSALRLFPAGSDKMEPYIRGSYWLGQDESFLLDVRDGSVLEIGLRHASSSGGNYPVDSYPVAQTDSGLWLVPVDHIYSLTSWGGEQIVYALAAPETVITGVGELYPIQTWRYPDEALG